ncbi:MAG: glycosyltransferase family 4 protein [Collinsella sp.]
MFPGHLDAYDIIHVHMASRASYERKAVFIRRALKSGKKVIIHHHGGEFGVWFDEELSELKRNEVRSLFAKADVVIVLSEEWLSWFDSRGFCTNSYIVMHNAVAVPEEPCSPCSHQDVLFLGRLDANKSPDVLLRASRRMLEEHPGSKLLFAGDGFPDRYEALARELGIAERCEFLGWITGEDKEGLLPGQGAYRPAIQKRRHAGMSVLLRPWLTVFPTVATPVGGVPQVIEDGVNGYIIPVGDESTLSAVLCRLAGSPSLRFEIGSAGRNTPGTTLASTVMSKELARIYEGLMI